METKVNELLDNVSGHVKDLSDSKTILGDEFTLGEYTCRPVIKVGTGFGSGMGTGEDPKKKASGTGTGAAAAVCVVPVGFLATRGGEISFIGTDRKTALASLFEKVPDLVEKVADMKKRESGDATEAAEGKEKAKKA